MWLVGRTQGNDPNWAESYSAVIISRKAVARKIGKRPEPGLHRRRREVLFGKTCTRVLSTVDKIVKENLLTSSGELFLQLQIR